MNLKQLRYFVTVAEELHFGRAAQRLHISQPPLSISIQQLESNLGFALFVRNNKNVALTDAGALFYREALMLLKHADEMQHIGERVAQGTIGHLRIGFTSSTLFRGLHHYISQFQQQYPQVDVSLKELNSYEQFQAIKQEQINLGFVHTLNPAEQIAHRLFLAEEFVCCMPKSHPLAIQDSIDLKLLQHEPFILFPRAVSPYYHDQITAICVNAGFSPNLMHEVRNWLTIVEFVELGLGIALVPKSMQSLKKDHARFIEIENNQILSETHCIWNRHNTSILLDNFLKLLSFAPQ
ncbi:MULTISPECIES: LysR family transcriptional regulator [unclassified Acinetobacter]|uniref:LysR family transcriptional regulator n=1 Tax=unclassified Acinetobacter TaxID=196816 RepID=UPI00190938DA|nr:MULTISPECIES: LysR family transcriptional regulator [unclassified Acinetobacter]MBK0062877.1 LysR family transcriptional regulator [Acinetobacter sp. S55]MBK0065546.1 LysR family transcriptional regulator [Acinetobacter sp. S54]